MALHNSNIRARRLADARTSPLETTCTTSLTKPVPLGRKQKAKIILIFNSSLHSSSQLQSGRLNATCAVSLITSLVSISKTRPFSGSTLIHPAFWSSPISISSNTSTSFHFNFEKALLTTSGASGHTFPYSSSPRLSTLFFCPPPFPSPFSFCGTSIASSSDAVGGIPRAQPAFEVRGTFEVRPASPSSCCRFA